MTAARDRTHCPRGHPYDRENTYTRPGTTCKALWAERARGGMSVEVRHYAPGAVTE